MKKNIIDEFISKESNVNLKSYVVELYNFKLTKTLVNGNIKRIARDFTNEYGYNYEDTLEEVITNILFESAIRWAEVNKNSLKRGK